MPASPLHRLTLATVVATVLLAALYSIVALRPRPAPEPTLATLYPTPKPLPEFVLTAHDGSRFDRARLTGHWSMLFLGFTQCPDLCPTTLTALAATHRALAPLPARLQPHVVLVSVDPEHDTPAVLARYVQHFDASFTGATGEASARAPLDRALGAYVSGDGTAGPATHSGAVYVVDPEARISAVYTTLPAPLALAADYRRVLRARGGT